MSDYENETINLMLNHKSVRKYSDKMPSNYMINAIMRAGQQAAFACQIYSVLVTRKGPIPFRAPLLFTICVDVHKFRIIMEKRNWELKQNDISLLLFGMQDANLALQNMILAAESLGLGTCLLGNTPYIASKIKVKYDLPDKVFPFVQLTIGYSEEDEIPRPRYPIEYTLFEDKYPEFDDKQIEAAMGVMDRGYLNQEYYKKANAMIKLPENRDETYNFETYSWTEHISRKCGLWMENSDNIRQQLKFCGFDLGK